MTGLSAQSQNLCIFVELPNTIEGLISREQLKTRLFPLH